MSKGKGEKKKAAPPPAPVRIKRDRAAAHQRRMDKKARKGMRVERGTARAHSRVGLASKHTARSAEVVAAN
jgi:hypothetical protein